VPNDINHLGTIKPAISSATMEPAQANTTRRKEG
jgi:hypothetical protein